MVLRLVPALAAALVLALPAPAHAASLTNSNGTLKFTAAAGIANVVSFSDQAGIVTVARYTNFGDVDPISSVSGCSTLTAGTAYLCFGVKQVIADAGNGNDVIDAGGNVLPTTGLTTLPITIYGGDGHDELYGGQKNDVIYGGDDPDTIYGGAGDDTITGDDGDDTIDGGDGNDSIDGGNGTDRIAGDAGSDSLSGGPGDDVLDGGGGSDAFSGGPGHDTAIVSKTDVGPPALSVAVGVAGADGNVQPDVEEVQASARSTLLIPGTVTLTGDAGPNTLTVLAGSGRITGGPGSDVLNGGPQDDTIDARDGEADTVTCGAGHDNVVADPLDTVAPDCETVDVAGVGTPSALLTDNDLAPSVSWSSPAAGANLSPNKPLSLGVSASDDRGISKVEYFAGSTLVCTVTTAPWACGWQAGAGDLGKLTLTAMAVDTSGQTATALRSVTLHRFTPRLTLKYAKGVASGKLSVPKAVPANTGCRGTVTVTVKAGKRTVRRHRVGVRRNCAYRTHLAAAHGTKVTARFGGNAVLAATASPGRAA